jgi:hypothetical protein
VHLELAFPDIHAAAPPEGLKILTRDLENGLFVAYVISDNDALRYVTTRDLSLARMTLTELHDHSVQNLVINAHRKPPDVIRMKKGAFSVLWDGWQEASLILIDQIWDDGAWGLTPGGTIAALPRQDMLAFCDAQSPSGIAELREITSEAFHGDRSLMTTFFHRRQARWLRYAE